MSRRASFYFGAALFLGIGLLAIYLLGRLVPYEHTVEHGASPEVKTNPYLAAEHFLRKQGIDVQRADSLQVLDQLPSKGHTLLLLGSRSKMTPRQAKRALDWAAKGGHLLFVAEGLWDEEKGRSDDLLLDSLGIRQYETDDYEEEEQKKEEPEPAEAAPANASADASDEPMASEDEAPPAPAEDIYPNLTKLYLENEPAPAYLGFDTDFHLYDSQNRAHAWANSGEATHMLQLYHGDGLITVLTDAWLWENDAIDRYDNAWLLWYLGQDSTVTLLYRADHDDLASLLWRHFPQALVAFALLVVLLLWHVGQRQGPLQAPLGPARRQLEEHVSAAADFLLRHGGQQSLLQGLQQDIQRRARRRHPGFERLAVADQWQILGRISRLPTAAISQAMRPLAGKRMSASDFTRQVANLQTLRNAL
jgi:hypothetical protein